MSTQDSPTLPPLELATLRRRPDVEDPTLQAHDATDELLVERALAQSAERGLTGPEIAMVGERHGAVALSLAAAGVRGHRVFQDRLAHERALASNAADLGLADTWKQASSLEAAVHGARLVLWQLPRSLAGVRHVVASLHDVATDAVLVAGGRVKHLSVSMNQPLEQGFGPVQPQLAHRKSRLLVAQRDPELRLALPSAPAHAARLAGVDLVLHGDAEAFGGAAVDPGTRFLLETLASTGYSPEAEHATVLDLGCGNGTIAAWAALTWPGTRVLASDDSNDAVRAASKTAQASGVAERVLVSRADAADDLPAASVDVVVLNPPFHQGGTVHTGIASKLMTAAARVLKTGGTLICVWNSHLQYRQRLERLVGPTRQIGRNKTFTLTASTVR